MEENKVLDAKPRDILPKKDVAVTEEMKKPEEKPATTAEKPKRRKTRDIEELLKAATKGMTDKEKENLINYLKENILGMENKVEALRKNCEAAYEKLRMMEDDYKAMEAYYKERMQYINEQTTAFHKAIKLSIVGGIN